MSNVIRPEFTVHRLNEAGMAKAKKIAEDFSKLLTGLEAASAGPDGRREMALVRTHLELASFYAKRAMACQVENQESP